ncbi:hypothetical protein QOT17_014612 [Balamuthia mandrillaris]
MSIFQIHHDDTRNYLPKFIFLPLLMSVRPPFWLEQQHIRDERRRVLAVMVLRYLRSNGCAEAARAFERESAGLLLRRNRTHDRRDASSSLMADHLQVKDLETVLWEYWQLFLTSAAALPPVSLAPIQQQQRPTTTTTTSSSSSSSSSPSSSSLPAATKPPQQQSLSLPLNVAPFIPPFPSLPSSAISSLPPHSSAPLPPAPLSSVSSSSQQGQKVAIPPPTARSRKHDNKKRGRGRPKGSVKKKSSAFAPVIMPRPSIPSSSSAPPPPTATSSSSLSSLSSSSSSSLSSSSDKTAKSPPYVEPEQLCSSSSSSLSITNTLSSASTPLPPAAAAAVPAATSSSRRRKPATPRKRKSTDGYSSILNSPPSTIEQHRHRHPQQLPRKPLFSEVMEDEKAFLHPLPLPSSSSESKRRKTNKEGAQGEEEQEQVEERKTVEDKESSKENDGWEFECSPEEDRILGRLLGSSELQEKLAQYINQNVFAHQLAPFPQQQQREEPTLIIVEQEEEEEEEKEKDASSLALEHIPIEQIIDSIVQDPLFESLLLQDDLSQLPLLPSLSSSQSQPQLLPEASKKNEPQLQETEKQLQEASDKEQQAKKSNSPERQRVQFYIPPTSLLFQHQRVDDESVVFETEELESDEEDDDDSSEEEHHEHLYRKNDVKSTKGDEHSKAQEDC